MASSAKRVSDHRARMRQQGLRQVTIWVPDTSAPGFAERAREWSQSLRDDPREREIMDWIDEAADTSGWDSCGFDEER